MDKLKDTCEKKYTLEVFDGQYGSEVKKKLNTESIGSIYTRLEFQKRRRVNI